MVMTVRELLLVTVLSVVFVRVPRSETVVREAVRVMLCSDVAVLVCDALVALKVLSMVTFPVSDAEHVAVRLFGVSVRDMWNDPEVRVRVMSFDRVCLVRVRDFVPLDGVAVVSIVSDRV